MSNQRMLGVLDYGDDRGYPFHSLFSGMKPIGKPKEFTHNVDAVVFWGGTDIWAGFYGEKPNGYNQNQHGPSQRDVFEWWMLHECMRRNVAIIGVCRGAQLLCAVAGGKLIQHADNHVGVGGGHELKTFDNRLVRSNTCHHQIMIPPADNDVEVIAWTEGLANKYIGEDNEPLKFIQPKMYREPEIVHFKKQKGLAIQGHPEWMEKGTSFVDYCLEMIDARIL